MSISLAFSIISTVISLSLGIILFLIKNSLQQSASNTSTRFDNVTTLMRSSDLSVKKEIESVDGKVGEVAKKQDVIAGAFGELKTTVALLAQKTEFMSGQISTLTQQKDNGGPRHDSYGRVIRKE